MEASWKRGYPLNHPFLFGIFHNQPAIWDIFPKPQFLVIVSFLQCFMSTFHIRYDIYIWHVYIYDMYIYIYTYIYDMYTYIYDMYIYIYIYTRYIYIYIYIWYLYIWYLYIYDIYIYIWSPSFWIFSVWCGEVKRPNTPYPPMISSTFVQWVSNPQRVSQGTMGISYIAMEAMTHLEMINLFKVMIFHGYGR